MNVNADSVAHNIIIANEIVEILVIFFIISFITLEISIEYLLRNNAIISPNIIINSDFNFSVSSNLFLCWSSSLKFMIKINDNVYVVIIVIMYVNIVGLLILLKKIIT